jgi:phytoene dehydrogenase-like protein
MLRHSKTWRQIVRRSATRTYKITGMTKMTPSTLRIGYRYRPKRLAPDYDAIVIGSGMGGLTTAALLSDLGKKVCVLEQHYTAGGYTHSYERAGYEWDVGVHYIGEVGAPTRTRKLFDYLSGGNLDWAPMDDEYYRQQGIQRDRGQARVPRKPGAAIPERGTGDRPLHRFARSLG